MTDVADSPNKSSRLAHNRRVTVIVAILIALLIVAFVAWRFDWLGGSASAAGTASLSNAPLPVQPKKGEVVANLAFPVGRDGHRPKSAESMPITKRPDQDADASPAALPDSQPPEICGMTTSEATAFLASKGIMNIPDAKPVLAEILSTYIQSRDLREKTLGLYVVAHQAGLAAADAERLNYPGCQSSDPCSAKPFQAMQQGLPANAAALVDLALTSGDLDVYVAALSACSGATSGACSRVSYARWAEIEPDNAVAWLMAATEANAKKDVVARDAALQRAATAKAYNSRAPSMAPIMASDAVRTLSPLMQSAIASEAFGVFPTTAFQMTNGITSYCGKTEEMIGARRETCDAVASTILEKDETLIAAMSASAIGKRVGWSEDRLQSIKDEYRVASTHMMSFVDTPNMFFTCDSLIKMNQFTQKMLTLGERSAAREFVKSTGKSVAELAAEYRKTQPASSW